MKRRTVLIALGAVLLTMVACVLATSALFYWALNNPEISATWKQFTSSLTDMADLQRELSAAYPAGSIRVGITNGHILTIALVNSDANKLSPREQSLRAEEVAHFAKKHYARVSEIDTIQVSFIQQGGAYGITLNFTNNYLFKLSELP